ncbi:MAG: hypothetical protein WC906_00095 [Parcubacteria group bacterium]|jgi:hypothetical protein
MLVIQNGNDIRCFALGPNEKGLWAGGIAQYKDGFHHTWLTTSSYGFYSAEGAKETMENIIKEVRRLDLGTEIRKINSVFSGET